MKKLIAGFIVCIMLLTSVIPCIAADIDNITLNVNMEFDYDFGGGVLGGLVSINGVTPADYGQKISIIIYKPSVTINTLPEIEAAVTAAGLDAADPERYEKALPLTDLGQIERIVDIYADKDGSYSAKIPMINSLGGKAKAYYIVSVSGNGLKADVSKASAVLYYETVEMFQDPETGALGRINNSNAAGISQIITENPLLLTMENNMDYTSILVEMREDDFNGEFKSMTEVREAIDAIPIVYSMKAANANELKGIFESNKIMFGVNTNDKDYKGKEDTIYENAVYIKSLNAPMSIKKAKTLLLHSMGLTAINSKNATNMTASIERYGAAFGIDLEKYAEACEAHGEIDVNKAFVEKEFKEAKEVEEAFDEFLTEFGLKNDEDEEEDDEDEGSHSTGGGGGGGYRRPISADVAPIATPSAELTPKFSDVAKDYWAYTEINTLAEMGVLSGKEADKFYPDDYVSREEFTKMLVSALKLLKEDAVLDFKDVESDRWSAPFIASAASRGIITGFDGMFNPVAQITRQDASVMLYRALNIKKLTIPEGEAMVFTDSDSIAEYAKESVDALAKAEIINGFPNGSFMPSGILKRAQAAKIICKLFQL